jgi:pyruvate-ferredoxin/flavodoxin oxidoreductase
MSRSMQEEQLAVECGYWPLFRFNPMRKKEGANPFTLDSKITPEKFRDFLLGENRFASLYHANPTLAEQLFTQAQKEREDLYAFYRSLSERP